MLDRIKKDVLTSRYHVNDRKFPCIDVDFDIQPNENHTNLRIMAVNVGAAAAVRRLLQGYLQKHRIRSVTSMLPTKTIPWEFVSLIEPDAARRVKLRISYNRLAQLHPADLADILEELSRDEQRSVIEALDDETAAEAVSEIPTRMQVALLNSMSAGRAADIIEEMAPDEAADVRTAARNLRRFCLWRPDADESANCRVSRKYGGRGHHGVYRGGGKRDVERRLKPSGIFPDSVYHSFTLICKSGSPVWSCPASRVGRFALRELSRILLSRCAHADEKAVIATFTNITADFPVLDDSDCFGRHADDVLNCGQSEGRSAEFETIMVPWPWSRLKRWRINRSYPELLGPHYHRQRIRRRNLHLFRCRRTLGIRAWSDRSQFALVGSRKWSPAWCRHGGSGRPDPREYGFRTTFILLFCLPRLGSTIQNLPGHFRMSISIRFAAVPAPRWSGFWW
jgi:hypothetical protein